MNLSDLLGWRSSVLHVALGLKDAEAKAKLFREELRRLGAVQGSRDGADTTLMMNGHEYRLHIRRHNDTAGIEKLLQVTQQGVVIGHYERLDWEIQNLMNVRGYVLG